MLCIRELLFGVGEGCCACGDFIPEAGFVSPEGVECGTKCGELSFSVSDGALEVSVLLMAVGELGLEMGELLLLLGNARLGVAELLDRRSEGGLGGGESLSGGR